MVKHIPVTQALNSIARDPDVELSLETPVWRAAAYKLFWIANTGGTPGRGQATRKRKAQEALMNRMIGVRSKGTLPVGVDSGKTLEFVDLTGELGDDS